jgi:epoxyqueuosine reductase
MDLDVRIRYLAEDWGADLFGVADLSQARDAILAQGGRMVAEYPRAISIGVALPHSIVNHLPRRTERAVAASYQHHAYDVINQRLDLIASRLSSVLQRERCSALPIPASQTADDERLCAVFSHKLGAHLAGLGWIGKSCLLITPEMGPRVRWATILTDAPLRKIGERINEGCGDCTECVDICPVKAFTGRAFREQEPREARYDAGKCDRYFAEMNEKDAGLAVCGLCLYICPYGREKIYVR